MLIALILALGSASGAHFNPAVTLADRAFGGIDTPTAVAYIAAQVTGGIVGVMVANVMFDLDAVDWSTKDRSAGHLVFADGVATLGLLLVIFGVVRSGRGRCSCLRRGRLHRRAPTTSRRRPASPTRPSPIARMFSDTFAGIEPASAPASSSPNSSPRRVAIA